MNTLRSRARPVLLSSLGVLALLAVYATASFALSRGADVMRHSSGIYDMDVPRVVADVTTRLPPYRASVHPLQKLLLAPIGGFVNTRAFGGTDRLAAARLLVAGSVALHALLVGVLAFQLSGGSRVAGAAAGGLCGVSFASILAASLPESAAFSCLASVLPLVLLNARLGKPFTWGETAAWGLAGVVGVGLTVTQIVHWAIAITARTLLLRRDGARLSGRDSPLARAGAALAMAILLTGAGVAFQARLYPGGTRGETPLAAARGFFRFDALAAAPYRHTARLLEHFALFGFAAPAPAYSDFLMRDYGHDYWSLSIEESGLRDWRPAPRAALALLVLAAVVLCVARGRFDVRFAAPMLSIASQFALHWVYGREYILYAPNWHGVLVAVLVAAAWNGWARDAARRRGFAAAAALLGAAMLANNLAVMRSVYREVELGLDASLRAPDGHPLAGTVLPSAFFARPGDPGSPPWKKAEGNTVPVMRSRG